MNGYFRPLRRKLGVIALVFACIATGGWIKSSTHIDYVYVGGRTFFSLHGGLFLMYQSGIVQAFDGRIHVDTDSAAPNKTTDPWRHTEWESHWKWRIVGFGQAQRKNTNVDRVPYWLVTIPLTLISAWLFLSKPRLKPVATRSTGDGTPRQDAI